MSSTQDAVNVFYIFMLYSIIFKCPEPDRVYMWETHEADSVLTNKLWLDNCSDKLFGAFIVQEDKRIYQNESEATSKVEIWLLDPTKDFLAAKKYIENCIYC